MLEATRKEFSDVPGGLRSGDTRAESTLGSIAGSVAAARDAEALAWLLAALHRLAGEGETEATGDLGLRCPTTEELDGTRQAGGPTIGRRFSGEHLVFGWKPMRLTPCSRLCSTSMGSSVDVPSSPQSPPTAEVEFLPGLPYAFQAGEGSVQGFGDLVPGKVAPCGGFNRGDHPRSLPGTGRRSGAEQGLLDHPDRRTAVK